MYGIPDEQATRTYEAWLRRQPKRDLREMLADPEIDTDSTAFIRGLLDDQPMTTEDAQAFRAAHDAEVRRLSHMRRTELFALEAAKLAAAGGTRLMGGPYSKDELISAILAYDYPIGKLNESTHVLYHDHTRGGVWSACEWCHPKHGENCDCAIRRDNA